MEVKNYINIKHVNDKNLIYANWKATYLTIEEVKEGTLLVLEAIKEYKTSWLVNDNRELSGSWDGANDWIVEVWMPQAIEAGLQKFAHIIAKDLYAQLSAEFMEDNTEKIEGGFELKMFDNYDDAENWLLN